MINFFKRKSKPQSTNESSKKIDKCDDPRIDLLMTRHTPVRSVARSDKGVYCLMCLQENYGRFWIQMDNGTYYCPEHLKATREKYYNSVNNVKSNS